MKSTGVRLACVLVVLLSLGCGSGGQEAADSGSGADVSAEGDAGTSEDAGAPDSGGIQDGGMPDTGGLPRGLPFDFTRPDVGEPLTADEISAFTRHVTGFFKKVDFFKWVLRTSHGEDVSHSQYDFMVWWTGVSARKTADLVTFYHRPDGGPDNIMIPTSKVLAQAVAAYLLTGDASAGKVIEQYSKGQVGTMWGMMFSQDDPDKYVMARAVMTQNHEYVIEGSKRKAVDYTEWLHPTEDWNTHTINVPNNPYWGNIWVKNMRSKDDVCHIYRTAGWLPYVVADGTDAFVRDAAAQNDEYLRGFAKDIVDFGYEIRTKGADGKPYVPTEDLASFVDFEWIDPNAECNAKITSALMGYGRRLKNNCEEGYGGGYEEAAIEQHYYNAAIIRTFHQAAVLHSLVHQENVTAEKLLKGLAERLDRDLAKPDSKLPTEKENWLSDLALTALNGASVGLPLTSQEARLIQQYWSQAVDAMGAWDKWDLWDASVPDGEYTYRLDDRIEAEEIAFIFEYCWSPFRNPAGAVPIDCSVLADPNRWGE
jgi:hypothetical protein